MIDLFQVIKNKVLLIGLNKADQAIDGRELTKRLRDEIQAFTKDEKKTHEIQIGPLRHLLCEMYEGLYTDNPEDLVPDLMQWVADIRGKGGKWQTIKRSPSVAAKSNFSPKKRI